MSDNNSLLSDLTKSDYSLNDNLRQQSFREDRKRQFALVEKKVDSDATLAKFHDEVEAKNFANKNRTIVLLSISVVAALLVTITVWIVSVNLVANAQNERNFQIEKMKIERGQK